MPSCSDYLRGAVYPPTFFLAGTPIFSTGVSFLTSQPAHTVHLITFASNASAQFSVLGPSRDRRRRRVRGLGATTSRQSGAGGDDIDEKFLDRGSVRRDLVDFAMPAFAFAEILLRSRKILLAEFDFAG